jgi:hypothetical protein
MEKVTPIIITETSENTTECLKSFYTIENIISKNIFPLENFVSFKHNTILHLTLRQQ